MHWTGSWFYEVTLQSAGIFQIGWATRYARFGSEVFNQIDMIPTSALPNWRYDRMGRV